MLKLRKILIQTVGEYLHTLRLQQNRLLLQLDTLVHLKVLVAATVIFTTVNIECAFGMVKKYRGYIYV